MSNGPWIKLYTRSLNNLRLRSMSPAERCVWYEALLLADEGAGHIRRPLAQQADQMKIPAATIRKALELLRQDNGENDPPMIEGTDEDYLLLNYAEHQRKPSETPEAWRDRQEKRRKSRVRKR